MNIVKSVNIYKIILSKTFAMFLQAEMGDEGGVTESSKFLLSHEDPDRPVDPEMQARLETLLEVAGEFCYS